ncbi:hypothetical protein TrCOL_g12832 [Triparma columacea]|uniref:Uncharacterized protein n=1 Tax=Triparma columacea TaxID=722753 RepID=A0A9W7GSJ0_9STRA|nr:hypothetical protein TrCOL_g12832 [Triparma columacea]
MFSRQMFSRVNLLVSIEMYRVSLQYSHNMTSRSGKQPTDRPEHCLWSFKRAPSVSMPYSSIQQAIISAQMMRNGNAS